MTAIFPRRTDLMPREREQSVPPEAAIAIALSMVKHTRDKLYSAQGAEVRLVMKALRDAGYEIQKRGTK